ncbi:hypothetical protein PRNP1_004909 [Phytophthora ramorum]
MALLIIVGVIIFLLRSLRLDLRTRKGEGSVHVCRFAVSQYDKDSNLQGSLCRAVFAMHQWHLHAVSKNNEEKTDSNPHGYRHRAAKAIEHGNS